MKLQQLKFAAFLLCIILGFTACQNDDDSTPIDEGESTADYFPLTLGNTWNYLFSEGGDMQIYLEDELVYNGNTYLITDAYSPIDGSPITQGYRKSGATYYGYNGEMSFSFSGVANAVIDPIEFIFFKDDLEVGESISSSTSSDTQVTNPITGTINTTTDFDYTTTLVAKDLTMDINGETYTDVIQVQLVLNISFMEQDYDEQQITYYFAKNIGPVQLDSAAGTYSIEDYLLIEE